MTREEQLEKLRKAREPKPKKIYKGLAKKSKKKLKQEAEEKELRNGDDTDKEKFFKAQRKRMKGYCQCGCGRPSSKQSDELFRHSIAHVFPKKDFKSVMYHPKVWVERAYWGGCHTNLDTKSIEHWPKMADWGKIKEIFYELSPLLTDKERSLKFYSNLEQLVREN